MRILSIISYPFLPATTGGEICTAALLNELSKKHSVTAFTVEPYKQGYEHQTGNTEIIYAMPFKPSRYFNPSIVSKLKKIIKQKNADWLLFEQPWMGWIIWFLRLTTKTKIAIRSHNIEYLRFKSMGKWFWQILYIYEKITYKSAHVVFFLSEADRQKAIYEFDLNPKKTLLTPYGVTYSKQPILNSSETIKNFKQQIGIKDDEIFILFFSTLSYLPNYNAVKYISEEIYPRLTNKGLAFKIIICGKGLPELVANSLKDKENIAYHGFVENLNLYIDAANLVLNPILSGGGIKTKAIDTLVRNQRVISTHNGAIGIDASTCGNNLIIIPDKDWDAFCNAIIQYANQPKQIPQKFYETYSWENIVQNLSKKLEDIRS